MLRVARPLARGMRAASRRLGRSGGTTAPGRLLLRVSPDALERMAPLVGANVSLGSDVNFRVDDRWVGDGYGIATEASQEAQTLAAQREAIFVDHTYTAKALAALIAAVRAGEFSRDQTVLFWHTGGQVALFA